LRKLFWPNISSHDISGCRSRDDSPAQYQAATDRNRGHSGSWRPWALDWIPLATIVFEFAGFFLFAGVLLLLGFGTPETADRYDGLNFHSVDLTPVAVTLLRRESDPDPSHFATLHIPRAAISFFSLDYATVGHPVQKKGLKRVPDNVEADNLSLALAYPGGQPFSIRAADYA
jgi:hypothetical protein